MSLLTRYSCNLPVEIAHLICLFTGKFVLDKKKRLRSIVNLYDFENIKIHIKQLSSDHMNRYCYYVNRERLVRMLYTQKKINMSHKKRIKEEVLLTQFVDYNRHPLLFLKASPIEDIFVPSNRISKRIDVLNHKSNHNEVIYYFKNHE